MTPYDAAINETVRCAVRRHLFSHASPVAAGELGTPAAARNHHLCSTLAAAAIARNNGLWRSPSLLTVTCVGVSVSN